MKLERPGDGYETVKKKKGSSYIYSYIARSQARSIWDNFVFLNFRRNYNCGMEKRKNQSSQIILILAATLVLVLLIRFGVIFRFNILLGLLIGAIFTMGWFLFNQRKASMSKRSFNNSPEGKINDRISYCRDQIEKIDTEITNIHKDIKDLQQNIQSSSDPQNDKEGQKLLKAFQAELELRKAKRTFFESCISKLEKILNNYKISQSLAAKKDKLKALQEEHYEDLANMEALRSDVEMDVFLLEDIDTLSLRTLESNSLESINDLRKELEEMTRDLNNQ